MRAFFELLPFRIGQVLIGTNLRARRANAMRVATDRAETRQGLRRRLFIDMAVISDHDAGTGIQRVVRELALALLSAPSRDWDVRFVSARRKKRYHQIAWPCPDSDVAPEEMRAQQGDVFLGLDYSLDAVRRHRRQLEEFRRAGGVLWFLVHDLLPLHRPEWFSPNTVVRYNAWLDILARLADGFFCNSPQTEAELRIALEDRYSLAEGYRTKVLPMAYARPVKQHGQGGAERGTTPRFQLSEPFALMVGTLEPRKGHADIIRAFEALWQRGRPEKLVLVGRLGWNVDALVASILSHPQWAAKLLWLDDVEDEELSAIYQAATGVIVASYGEGFGLPLIEALSHGKPVLARDLPVFRPHANKGVRYFPGHASVQDLAQATGRWLDEARRGLIEVTAPTDNWRDSAQVLLEALKKGARTQEDCCLHQKN